MSEETLSKEQTAPVPNLLLNTKQIAALQKIAAQYARSGLVPLSYQENPDNCFVACELAARMNVSPILIMQTLCTVQGRPVWSGRACKAPIDSCGQFAQSEYIFTGERGRPEWGCCLQAVKHFSGKMVKGATVTWQMAQEEGWVNKIGSKWKTMPEQMMKYRAAAFFARAECPEILMGYLTVEEAEDIGRPEPKKITVTTDLFGR